MKGPILKGPRVTLRPIKLSDAPTCVRWFRDSEVSQYMKQSLYKISLAKEKAYLKEVIKSDKEIVHAVIAEDGRYIGNVGTHLDSPFSKVAGFGIVIGDKRYWGRRYAGECIELLKKFVFEKLKYNRWRLIVFVENKRAIKVYKRAGFKTEGRLRQQSLSRVDGKFHDQYIMSILRQEYLKKKVKK